jgi:septal ring factor EnvC (AmiA/AmiB activator)
LIKAKAEKEKSLLALQEESKKLESEEKIRQSEITQARGKERELRQALQQKQRQADQLNSQIEKLIAEEVARQEREEEARRLAEAKKQAAKPAADTKTPKSSESSAKTETASPGTGTSPRIDPNASRVSAETFNLSKDFAANKGKLPMPVTGASTIVGNFGTKRHSEWNVTTNSNGVDIQAERGADIRAVFDGEVSKVFSFPGSNTCVIVRHGDYYTFYANIYDLYVKQGDKVKAGQSLGRIFTDPDTDRMRHLNKIVLDELENIATNGPRESDFSKVKEYMNKSYNENLKENRYWLNILDNKYFYGEDMHTKYLDTLNSITRTDIQNFVANFLKQGNVKTIVMLPNSDL